MLKELSNPYRRAPSVPLRFPHYQDRNHQVIRANAVITHAIRRYPPVAKNLSSDARPLRIPLRFLLRVIPNDPDRRAFFASTKALAKNLGARVTHPRWTSYGALEVDVFAPSLQDFGLFTSVMEPLAKVEFTRNLDEPPRFQPKEKIIEEAVGYFNAERYWECHEALEGVWRAAKGKEKLLVQGIILVCAAMVHEQRGENDIALGIFRRALPQISWKEQSYCGIDIRQLRKRMEVSIARGALSPFRI